MIVFFLSLCTDNLSNANDTSPLWGKKTKTKTTFVGVSSKQLLQLLKFNNMLYAS